MKLLITVRMLAALFVSPALAQKYSTRADARAAYAQAAAQATTDPMDRETMNGPDGQIFWLGSAKGKDPDPFIRGSMVRGYGNMGGL